MGRGSSKAGGPAVDLGDGNYHDAFNLFDSPPPPGGERKRWENSLTSGQKDAVEYYTGSGYKNMNRALRKGEGSDYTKEQIKQLDEALANFDLKKNMKFYRGSDSQLLGGASTVEEIQKLVGGTVKDNGFTSMSTSKDGSFGGSIWYEITVKKGKGKGAYVSGISSVGPGESEFLTKRGTTFKITGVREHKRKDGTTVPIVSLEY